MARDAADKVAWARSRASRVEAQDGVDRVQDVLCAPARLRIFAAFTVDELTVSDLAAAIDRKVPATSQHLRLLRELELVERQRRGNAVYYRLRPGPAVDQLRAVLETLDAYDPAASSRHGRR